jgi:C-terminal processing protease CtpA/Prc
VGYLRLPVMDDDLVPHLHESMARFRETPGLIVDVRGNGGGSRDLLIALAGYLAGPDEGPWVASAARYILSERFDTDHLEARFMYRAGSPAWTPEQRRAIEEFAHTFAPEWEPEGRSFSDWHYIVLGRTGHPNEYFYDKPVVVLCDAGCFSATDVFLGALSGRPRITLMGTPSGGGSARVQDFTLPHSRIGIRCASMVSYRPDGRLYDGRGVEVDIEVHPAPTDLIAGGTDSVLDAAERVILSGRAQPPASARN